MAPQAEPTRWFWHLAGELEAAELPGDRRSIHRALSYTAALMAEELLRDRKSVFRRKSPEPPFRELLIFLRRLRWALLWQLLSEEARDESTETRASLRDVILDEALAAYPCTPAERETAVRLFNLIGRDLTAHGSAGDVPPNEEARNHWNSSMEGLMGLPIIYSWLSEGEGFVRARKEDLDPLPFHALLTRSAQFAAGLPAKNPTLCGGVTGTEAFDLGLARALESGKGNVAIVSLINLEDLDAEVVAGLDVEDLRSDDLGTALEYERPVGPLGSSRQIVVRRLTPYTAMAIDQYLEGRTSGPLIASRTGARLIEGLVWHAYIQAMAPERLGADGSELSL